MHNTKNGIKYYEKRQPEPDATLSEYTFWKLPPQCPDLEEAVLGAIMTDREAMMIVVDILRPTSFYSEKNALIYSACLSLYGKGNPIDVLTVSAELRASGNLAACGGSAYLAELTNMVASAANIEYHARIIAQKSLQREIIAVGQWAVRSGYEDTQDVFTALHDFQRRAFDLGNTEQRTAENMGHIGLGVIRHLNEAMQKPDGVTGVPSGIEALDQLTGGWQNTDLVIIAGRPGTGKTGAVLCFAINAAKRGNPVAFFSLEMEAGQLVQRAASLETGIPSDRIRGGRVTADELRRIEVAVSGFNDVPLFIDDTPGLNIFELRAKARRLLLKHGIRMIIVDYLQLMTGADNAGSREQEISGISRGLKNLAKELGIPVIALSQLSRAVESRGGSKRPMLSDLRESGAIEQDSDIVAFIYRPEYYGIKEDEQGKSLSGFAEFIIAKHRHGALETIGMSFDSATTRFSDVDAAQSERIRTIDVVDYTVPASARPSLDDDSIPF